MQVNKFPLGIKTILIIFSLDSIDPILILIKSLPILFSTEITSDAGADVLGKMLGCIFLLGVFLTAIIGLLRLRSWSVIWVSLAIILGGISFGINFNKGFLETYVGQNETIKMVFMLLGWIIAAIIMIVVIRYIRRLRAEGLIY